MRYIIHKNVTPPKRVSMRLHVDAGSLNEADNQRGVAHFLEHMVFNGTKHFPDATKLVPQMQRLGIAFGAHANAYTSFDETVYMLDLPNIDQSTRDLGFAVMGDFADGALLSNAEIDEERGVISAEKTSRASVRLRMFEKQFSALLPNSIVKDRLPIGTDEIIANAPRERFVDFYTRFYTPEKMTFVYVGDLDVAEAEKTIKATFGAIKNPKNQGAKATMGDLSTPTGLQSTILTDNELSTTDIDIIRTRPLAQKPDSKAKRNKSLQIQIANSILSRRFSRIAKLENAKIISGSASRDPLFREVDFGSISVGAVGSNWKAAIPVLEQEFRRAVDHGFTQSEYDEVVAEIINSYEQSVHSAATRKTDNIASSLISHAHEDAVYSTPETDLAILKENLVNVTPISVHQTFTEFWSTEDIHLVLSTKEAASTAQKELKQLFLDSKNIAIDAPKEKETTAFAYTAQGKPGDIVTETHIKDLDIQQFTLANGIKVNFKKTDFDKNSISLIASFGSGTAGLPADKPGLDSLSSAMISAGGLGQHSNDDLQTILAGRNVGVGFSINDDSFSFTGSTTPKDLQLQLELLAAYFSDPGYRPEALRQYQAVLPALYSQLEHTDQGALAKMRSWYASNDSRFTLPTLEQAQALTEKDVKAWLAPQFAQNQIELSIVGDADFETIKSAVASTLGTLPQRTETNTVSLTARTLNTPAFPTSTAFTFDSEIQKAIAIVLWKFADATDRDVSKMRRANILAAILDDRLRVELRENLGIAYSPYAGADLSRTFVNASKLMAYSPGKPKDTEKVGKIIVGIADKLAKEGATEDELQRVLKPQLGILSKSTRQNSYWLNSVLNRSQSYPDKLAAALSREADYKSITIDEVNALAKQFFTQENSARISISPSSK